MGLVKITATVLILGIYSGWSKADFYIKKTQEAQIGLLELSVSILGQTT
jgi:hypothetical protein